MSRHNFNSLISNIIVLKQLFFKSYTLDKNKK